MSRKYFPSVVISMVLLLSFSLPSIEGGDTSVAPRWGPRVDYLQLLIYQGYEQEFMAFKQGQIDVMDWPLLYESYMQIKDDPNFVIKPLTMFDEYTIDLNCMRWPTSDVAFRKALAYLVPYEDFYINVLKCWSGELMDNLVWCEPEWSEWYNGNAPKYWYDKSLAIQILNNAGYKDWDNDGWLEWKAPNGTIFELPKLQYYARKDDPLRAALGQMHAEELESVGIPVDLYIADKEVCWAHAFCRPYDYNLYTDGWGPYNNLLWLYDYFHSKFANPHKDWAWNCVFFKNGTYDYWIEKFRFAPDMETAKFAVKQAQAIIMDQIPCIPVYHSSGASAHRAKYGHWSGEEQYWDKPWKGFPNVKFAVVTSGVSDWWTFLNAYPEGFVRGGVLRFGMLAEVDHPNPCTEYSTWDMFLVSAIYSTLILKDPFTGNNVPYLAKDWTIEKWNKAGKNATKITFHIYKGIKWSDGTPLTSQDVAFTMKYMYDTGETWAPYAELIDGIETATPHIETPDPYTVTIYFSIESIWCLDLVGFIPIIPKHVWEKIPPERCEEQGEYVIKGNLTGSGPFIISGHRTNEWWLLKANPYFFRYLPGDINCDGTVDIFDFSILHSAYGSNPISPNWIPDADINGDKTVDIYDFSILHSFYGTKRDP